MRRTRRFTGVALGAALLVALAIGTNAGAQEESTEVELTPSRDSGVSGTATFADVADGVEVTLNIQGAPEGGVEHLAHIHETATCADDRNDQGGPVEFPLTPITVEDDGTGSSTAIIKDVTVAQLFDDGKERYANVHAVAEGSGVPPGISCADLVSTPAGGNLPTSGGIVSPVSLLFAGAALMVVLAGFFVLRRGA